MFHVILCVREPGKAKVDYSRKFDLPEIPRPGDFISVHCSDPKTPHTQDFVVRSIWWRLETSETRAYGAAADERVGSLKEIFVECEMTRVNVRENMQPRG